MPDYAAVLKRVHGTATQPLADFWEFIDSGRPISERKADQGIPAYEVSHIESGYLKETDIIVAPDSDRILQRYDILTGRVGTLGKFAAYLSDSPASFSDNTLRLRPKAQDRHRCAFVVGFLNSTLGNVQLLRDSRGGLQKVVTQESLSRIVIPILGDRETKLVEKLRDADASSRRKQAEADALLTSLDGWLLKQLGLTPPAANPRRVFAIRMSEARLGRYDPDFHSPQFRAIRTAIERGNHPARSVREVCGEVRTGFAAGKQDQAFDPETGVPHLRPLNLNTFGEISIAETKYVPKESVAQDDYCQPGEVLFNNTNSTEMVGKSAVFELEQPCACSNHITRLHVKEGIEPHYLAALFNALRSTGFLGLLSTTDTCII